jgi:hypothetical protein
VSVCWPVQQTWAAIDLLTMHTGVKTVREHVHKVMAELTLEHSKMPVHKHPLKRIYERTYGRI